MSTQKVIFADWQMFFTLPPVWQPTDVEHLQAAHSAAFVPIAWRLQASIYHTATDIYPSPKMVIISATSLPSTENVPV